MERNIIERLRNNKMTLGHGEYGVDPLCEQAADEIERLRKYRELVMFIANDYYELSHDKIEWQRNDWMKRCGKLIEELEND